MNLSGTSVIAAAALSRPSWHAGKPRGASTFRSSEHAAPAQEQEPARETSDEKPSRSGTQTTSSAAQPCVRSEFAAQVIGQILGTRRLNAGEAIGRYAQTADSGKITSLTV
jgi:hypothetical protein